MTTATKVAVYPLVHGHELLIEGDIPENLLIVDVRTPTEYSEVHIPGSLNVPLGNLSMNLENVKAQGAAKQVVVMCRTQNRAAQAYDRLVQAGVPNCRVLEGGISKWIEAQHPVVEGRKAISLERQVRMAAGFLVALGVLLGVTVHSWFHVIPAIVGVGLFHAGLTDSCRMALVLARLPYNR